MTDYKQLAKELYETLQEVSMYLPVDRRFPKVNNIIQKYEQESARGTGRTTALYMKAIAEALANPGKPVEFQDHSPLDFHNICSHSDNLRDIITKLGYDIVVSVIASSGGGDNKIILNNRFNK